MKNCIILGSGRSGTSMVAGTLAKSGYFMGDNLYPPRESNPKGFFEDPFINGINEEIIANVRLGNFNKIRKLIKGNHLRESQRWLEALPLNAHLLSSINIENKIIIAVNQSPFCFKDPRFSYTLPIWRPFLNNIVFICIFRDPGVTAQSIVKECAQMDYLKSVNMSFELGLDIWFNTYNHILQLHRCKGEWLFIHYDQVMTVEGIARIQAHTEAYVDFDFPDISLKRTISEKAIGTKYQDMYRHLNKLAGFYS